MVGIVPSRFSYGMIKEGGCFVVNLPDKSFQKEYDILGSKSGRDMDKFKELGIKYADGEKSGRAHTAGLPGKHRVHYSRFH